MTNSLAPFKRDEVAEVAVMLTCQVCAHHHPTAPPTLAFADASTPMGWAFVCLSCFIDYRCTLGVGRGQVLLLDTTKITR